MVPSLGLGFEFWGTKDSFKSNWNQLEETKIEKRWLTRRVHPARRPKTGKNPSLGKPQMDSFTSLPKLEKVQRP